MVKSPRGPIQIPSPEMKCLPSAVNAANPAHASPSTLYLQHTLYSAHFTPRTLYTQHSLYTVHSLHPAHSLPSTLFPQHTLYPAYSAYSLHSAHSTGRPGLRSAIFPEIDVTV